MELEDETVKLEGLVQRVMATMDEEKAAAVAGRVGLVAKEAGLAAVDQRRS